MLKYILFITISVPLGFYAWKKLNDKKPIEQVQTSIEIENENENELNQKENENKAKEKTFKDENLHKAFAKILSIEKKKKRKFTIDELILEYRASREVMMTLEEIKLIIIKLEDDIHKEERKYAVKGAEGQDLEGLEVIINAKKEELENFKFMEYQYTGVAIGK